MNRMTPHEVATRFNLITMPLLNGELSDEEYSRLTGFKTFEQLWEEDRNKEVIKLCNILNNKIQFELKWYANRKVDKIALWFNHCPILPKTNKEIT